MGGQLRTPVACHQTNTFLDSVTQLQWNNEAVLPDPSYKKSQCGQALGVEAAAAPPRSPRPLTPVPQTQTAQRQHFLAVASCAAFKPLPSPPLAACNSKPKHNHAVVCSQRPCLNHHVIAPSCTFSKMRRLPALCMFSEMRCLLHSRRV